MRLNPNFSASDILCSIRLTGRISPDSPTSPVIQVWFSMAMSILDERIALIIDKSIAGSLTFNPPAIFRNTSFCASLNPTRFSRTAKSIFILLKSNPVADRCGVPYAAVLTKDCVSIRNGRIPSMAAAMATPLNPS